MKEDLEEAPLSMPSTANCIECGFVWTVTGTM